MSQQSQDSYAFEKEEIEIDDREDILDFEEDILEEDLEEPKMYILNVTDSGFYAVSQSSDDFGKAIDQSNEEYVPRITPGVDVHHEGDIKSVAYVVPGDDNVTEYLEDYIETKYDEELVGGGVAAVLTSDERNNLFRGCLEEK